MIRAVVTIRSTALKLKSDGYASLAGTAVLIYFPARTHSSAVMAGVEPPPPASGCSNGRSQADSGSPLNRSVSVPTNIAIAKVPRNRKKKPTKV